MAFAAALRRAASSAVAITAGTIRRCACHRSSALLFSLSQRRSIRRLPAGAFPSRSFSFAPSSDSRLLKVIDDEIRSSIGSGGHDEDLVPNGFPFKIIDNPGDETITLKWEYGTETISVVLNPETDLDMEDAEDDDHSGDEDSSIQLSISLIVTVNKGDDSSLEFRCNVNTEELQIHHMTMSNGSVSDDQKLYGGPTFSDLDENLQKEFYKYLEERGIGSSLFEFLHDYMIKKGDREYLTWLSNMKEFIEA